MIKLFSTTATSFSTNGIGSLPDVISGVVVEERNGEYELELQYPIDGLRYSEISLRRIIVCKPNPFSSQQPFRIYSISRPINGIVTINASHISYDLSGCSVSPFTANTVKNAFVNMKAASTVVCPFTFYTDKDATCDFKVIKPTSIRSILGTEIIDVSRGEYEFDNFTVNYLNKRGQDRGVSIRYGKNLTDLKQEENCNSVYTAVHPYWYVENEGLVVLDEKIINAPGTYDFTRIYPLDLSSVFIEKPTQAELREYANLFISNNDIGIPKVSLDVSFIQLGQTEEYKDFASLETVKLCDTVHVDFPKLRVSATAKCIRVTYNILTDRYDSLELGEAKNNLATTISDGIKNTDKKIEEAKVRFTAEIDTIKIGLADIDDALIKKANIETLIVVQADIDTLRTNKADIKDLTATNIIVNKLVADSAIIDTLVAEDVKINKALITKANISDLTAVNAVINTLSTDVAEIDTLVSGGLTSVNIQSLNITSDKFTVENGFIKNAMVQNLDVSKINAGDISVNKFRIKSDSGNLLISDNTIQIKDSTRVRVQIGKDASNDYNMYLWDSAGKLMFDATGLKADGIKSKIIRDDMVSDTANISGDKLNISSVVSSINNGVTNLNSSKILLDGTAQTLNVAFNSLSTKVDAPPPNIITEYSITKLDGAINGPLKINSIKGRTLKNELNYNPNTWVEWTVSSAWSSAKDNTGLTMTALDTPNWMAFTIPVNVKVSTKYGCLYNIVYNSLSSGLGIRTASAFKGVTNIPLTIGNNKMILTSLDSITDSVFGLGSMTNTEVAGNKIKITDIRIFELVTGSQIETDFNTMTTDQLANKYPFGRGIQSVGEVAKKIEISSRGKNLFSGGMNDIIVSPLAEIVGDNIKSKDTSGSAVSLAYFNKYVLLEKGLNYTLKIDSNAIRISLIPVGLDPLIAVSYYQSHDYRIIQSITNGVAFRPDWTGRYVLSFYLAYNTADVKYVSTSNIQIEQGSISTTYEPYQGDEISIPLIEPLRSLPNGICDEVVF